MTDQYIDLSVDVLARIVSRYLDKEMGGGLGLVVYNINASYS